MNAQEKGARGEKFVAGALERHFPGVRRFDNLIVEARNGLTQIDHVLMCATGIFVIEIKRYEGRIFGDADAERWVQRIRDYTTEFGNPLHQNARHVSALKWQLGLSDVFFHSVVAFIGRAELAKPIAPNVIATFGFGCPGLVSYIRSFRDDKLLSGDLDRGVRRLEQLAKAGYTHDQLLDSIRERRTLATQSSQSTRRVFGCRPILPEGGKQYRVSAIMQHHTQTLSPAADFGMRLSMARQKYRELLNRPSSIQRGEEPRRGSIR